MRECTPHSSITKFHLASLIFFFSNEAEMGLYPNWLPRGAYFLVFFWKCYSPSLFSVSYFSFHNNTIVLHIIYWYRLWKITLKVCLMENLLILLPCSKHEFLRGFFFIIKFESLTVFPCSGFTLEVYLFIQIKLQY